MYIFEIITPGTNLARPDFPWRSKINLQLSILKSSFFQANLALNKFNLEMQRTFPPLDLSVETWERKLHRRKALQNIVRDEHRQCGLALNEEEIKFQADIRFKREEWDQGRIPERLLSSPSLYARAFLFALDNFDKTLRKLAKEAGVPTGVQKLHDTFGIKFPDMRNVRNSTQHIEDRSRGLDQKLNPIISKPFNNGSINDQGTGTIILGGLCNSSYGATMSNGEYGEVDVTVESMEHLQQILEGVLQCFTWEGPKCHEPESS